MQIYIYNEIPENDLDMERVLTYMQQKLPKAVVELRQSFVAHFHSEEFLKKLSNAWNKELSAQRNIERDAEERLAYEKQVCQQADKISPNVIYNGWYFWELLQSRIPCAENSTDKLHLFLTPRLFVTQDEGDRRLHARTILMGQPSVVSSSGLVEAPARPMEYYIVQAGYHNFGQEIPEAELKRFEGKYLDYHDLRLTDVMIGYILQTIAYRFWGEGFCGDSNCRLFNAHRQQEMLNAQLAPPEFCDIHQRLFNVD